MARRLSAAEDYESLLSNYDTWMFDCDGVLWHGDRPIEGAVEVLDMLRKRGKPILHHHLSQQPAHPPTTNCMIRKAPSLRHEQCYQVPEELQGQVRPTRRRSTCGRWS